jgi:hypothetical protein
LSSRHAVYDNIVTTLLLCWKGKNAQTTKNHFLILLNF